MNQSKLVQCMTRFPQTDIWMDSFDASHHDYALKNCCVGITTSPTWVAHMVQDEFETQKGAMLDWISCHPDANERQLLWLWTLNMGRERSQCMRPLWEQGDTSKGRFAIQVDVYASRSTSRMVEMAMQVHALGPNMQVKIPCTKAGIAAMEEATFQGVSVMATLCFSVSQAVCAAEAIARGLARRQTQGLSVAQIRPVCAVLLGMQEQWLANYAEHHDFLLPPETTTYAGEAICKRVYEIFQSRGYATRVLVAYYRHVRHWSAFMGGDLIMTIPYKWQKRFESCDIPIANHMDTPVPPEIRSQLMRLPPFVQAWEENALCENEFDTFGPVILTLRYFQQSYDKAVLKFRDLLLPDPLVQRAAPQK